MISNGRGLGIIIERLSEILEEFVFPDKSQEKINKSTLNLSLKEQANLSIASLVTKPFALIEKKLLYVNEKTMEQTLDFIYRKYKQPKRTPELTQTINTRLTEIINYLDQNTNELSIPRNNIRNSIEHDIPLNSKHKKAL
ncbi:hypothetical protein [Wenyingzhuangia sp. IMCC45574]